MQVFLLSFTAPADQQLQFYCSCDYILHCVCLESVFGYSLPEHTSVIVCSQRADKGG